MYTPRKTQKQNFVKVRVRSDQNMAVVVRSLDKKETQVPMWTEQETVAQWLRRIAAPLQETFGVKIVFEHGHFTLGCYLRKPGQPEFNTFNLRNKLMAEVCGNDAQPILLTYFLMGSLQTHYPAFLGNMDESKRDADDDECSLCSETVTGGEQDFLQTTISAIPSCLHKFHTRCLADVLPNEDAFVCPLCRRNATAFVQELKQSVAAWPDELRGRPPY